MLIECPLLKHGSADFVEATHAAQTNSNPTPY